MNCELFKLIYQFMFNESTPLFLIHYIITEIRDVSIKADPSSVNIGEQTTLKCSYTLEGESLLSVKFFGGRREFYRYTPNDSPKNKVFQMSDAFNVDVSNMKCEAFYCLFHSYFCK